MGLWNENAKQILEPFIKVRKATVRCLDWCCTMPKRSSWAMAQLYGIRKCCFNYWWDRRQSKLNVIEPDECEGFTRLEIDTFRWIYIQELPYQLESCANPNTVTAEFCDCHTVALIKHLTRDGWPSPESDALPSSEFFEWLRDAL